MIMVNQKKNRCLYIYIYIYFSNFLLLFFCKLGNLVNEIGIKDIIFAIYSSFI